MIKLILTLLFLLILFSGCTDCIIGEDRNITVSLIENKDIENYMGLSHHHNVSIDIINTRASAAKKVTVTSYYCNDFTPQLRRCVNQSFNIGDIPPNGHVLKFFEYDRTALDNPLDGKYQLQYKAESCLN